MKKCDGQVEGRLKHFFSIMELATQGLVTTVRPAETTENAEEKPKPDVCMCEMRPRQRARGGSLRLQVRAGIGNYQHSGPKISLPGSRYRFYTLPLALLEPPVGSVSSRH